MQRNPVIFQISDLHFGKSVRGDFWKRSINEDAMGALRRAILSIEPRPDFILVTGDVANGGKVKELKEARQYLESILNDLWKLGQATRCILVPGNHDVWRTTWARPRGYVPNADRLREWDSVFDGWSFLAPDLPADEGAHVRPFSMDEYYQTQSEKNSGQLAKKAATMCEFFPAFDLVVFKLDSNIRLKRRPGHIARGTVSIKQRQVFDDIIQAYEIATQPENRTFADARRIALVHHHLTRLPNVKLEKWMLMDDAGEVARWLARHQVRLVLHGHFHKGDVLGLTYWNTEYNSSRVETIVVAAGSATALDVDDGHNSCHYIRLGHFRTKVWRLNLDHGEYQPISTAESFHFTHKPNLFIEDNAKKEVPVFLEALETLLAKEEDYADENHRYELVKSIAFIEGGSRSYFAHVEFHGTNITSASTNHIPLTFVAVGAQYFRDFECRAWDISAGTELTRPDALEERSISLFPVRINFSKPLQPNESFGIRVHFKLSSVMLEEKDYDMLSLLRFPRGVAKVEMAMLSEKSIVGPKLFELRGGKLRTSSVPLKAISKIPLYPSGKPATNGYEAISESPASLAYVLYYDKLA